MSSWEDLLHNADPGDDLVHLYGDDAEDLVRSIAAYASEGVPDWIRVREVLDEMLREIRATRNGSKPAGTPSVLSRSAPSMTRRRDPTDRSPLL